FVSAPLLVPARTMLLPVFVQRFAIDVPPGMDLTGRSLIILHGPSGFHTVYFPTQRALQGLSVPRNMRFLSPSGPGGTVSRPEDPSLVWLDWSDGAYQVTQPPAVGSTRLLPPAGIGL